MKGLVKITVTLLAVVHLSNRGRFGQIKALAEGVQN
jgi:hypothetical protein